MANSWADAVEVIERAGYELSKTRRRVPQLASRPPTGARPAIVQTECSPANGTGDATTNGRLWFLDHADNGAKTIRDDNDKPGRLPTVFYNIFQARIPVDVVIWVIKYKGKWYLVAADCEPGEIEPLYSPIKSESDPYTMQEGDGTVMFGP